MAPKWEEVPLEQLKAQIKSAFAMGPFGSKIKAENFTTVGVPVIKGGNLNSTYMDEANFDFLTQEKADELESAKARKLDIVITHRGTLGQVGLIPEDSKYEEYVVSQSQLKMSFDITKVDPYFIYYFLKSPLGQSRLLSNVSQVGVPAIAQALTSVRAIEIPLPPDRVEQERISKVLRDFDQKINLNRRINETLEAMAKAIFKSWFVDFDPVKAKIAAIQQGRDPLRAAMTVISGKPDAELDTLLPEQYEQLAATAALFPEEMEESELGEIPRGWEASQVGKITSRVSMGPFGSDIKKENFVEAGVPVIRGGNLTDGLVERNYVFISESKANELKNANAFPGDIVITHRGTLGQVGLIPRRSKFPRYVVSQSQMLLSVNIEQMSPRYLFEFLRSENGKRLLLANTSQVGVPAIARPTGSVKTIPLVVPDKTVLDAYDKVLDPFLTELSQMVKSSETLAELREALLPRLISGELSVNSLTKAAGAT